jgi:hypothetical protein
MPDPEWPARTVICLECRATFTDIDEPHVHPYQLVSLRKSWERKRLISQVWGAVTTRRRFSPRRMLLSITLGGAALGGLAAVFVPMLGVGGPATAGAGLLVMLVAQALRNTERVLPEIELIEERQRAHPLPGSPAQPRLAGGSAIVATVDPGKTVPSPLTGVAAVAFGVILSAGDHDTGKLLRDGATLGFSLTTLDGDTIEIPAGSIEIIAHGAPQPVTEARIEAYLDSLDPLRLESNDDDPFSSYEHIAEIAVRPGDHVAVHNPIKRVAFASEGGYRQAARQVFAVEGTPCIELLS